MMKVLSTLEVLSYLIINMKPIISWSDFEKLDIRAGTILAAREFPKPKPAYRLTIDFGPLGITLVCPDRSVIVVIADLPGGRW